MKYIIDLPENQEVALSDGHQTKIIQPDNNKMVVFNCGDDILRLGFTVKLTPYNESEAEQRGQEEAWELARHLYNVSPDVTESIYRSMNGGKGLGVALEMPYAEAKAKYDAWRKLKDELQIGDEVKHDKYGRCVLLEKRDLIGAELWHVIDGTGKVCQINRRHIIGKTGRTFPEVAELLEKMRNPDADH